MARENVGTIHVVLAVVVVVVILVVVFVVVVDGVRDDVVGSS